MNRQAEGFMAQQATLPAAGVGHPHESAHLHVAGEALYVDDIPRSPAPFMRARAAEKAHARIRRSTRQRAAPKWSRCSRPPTSPERTIAGRSSTTTDTRRRAVQYVGQPMFVVVPRLRCRRRAARLAKVDYDVLPPVLTPQEAKRLRSYVLPPMHLRAATPTLRWPPHRAAWAAVYVGGQEQFYLEGRSPTRCPRKTGASTSTARRSIRPRCSTSSRTR
jgi:xanthine dehydrogenase large subunit